MIRVKICCISFRWDAAQAVRAGASAPELVSAMPSGLTIIDDEAIGFYRHFGSKTTDSCTCPHMCENEWRKTWHRPVAPQPESSAAP